LKGAHVSDDPFLFRHAIAAQAQSGLGELSTPVTRNAVCDKIAGDR
jgi:hypothetical protein